MIEKVEKVFCQRAWERLIRKPKLQSVDPCITRADGRDSTTERPPRQKESGGVRTGQRIWSIIDRKQEGKQASLTTGVMV
jgi:hypothetical protein